MTVNSPTRRAIASIVIAIAALGGCSDGSDRSSGAQQPEPKCAETAPRALQMCLSQMNAAAGNCYFDGGSACAEGDPTMREALVSLQEGVEGACADGDFLGLSTDAVVGRLQNACQSQSDSIAWRTFGGPQGAVWPAIGNEGQSCLQLAHETVSGFFDESLVAVNNCLAESACDAAALNTRIESAANAATVKISEACPVLEDLIAVDPATYVDRASAQVDCTVATAHENVEPLELGCGPSNAEASPARGAWTQIVLDGDKWGTLCGDGTDYAIYLRLAPQGNPLDRVLVGLEGGGVCIFEGDCRNRLENSPHLFNAQDENLLDAEDDGTLTGLGIMSNDALNPFADWTKVYLPYCNQDVFAGGGVVEHFSDFDLPRYGAINARSGMRVVRDVIWRQMDEEGGAGFRPDEMIALFGGFSAGGYGAMYNYHWVLDDLQWPRTAAFPDAGGGLDNGGVGVRTLGHEIIPVWGARPYLPPYCFSGDCAVGPDMYAAVSPRLKQVPEQQYLILSNQKDLTQQGDAFFFDEAQWIDAMRAAYCDTRDLPGIQWYLTSDSANSVHVVSIRDEFFYGEVAGEKMVDWFWRAVTDPDSIADRAEEGNFTTDIPGSNPFPCELAR